MLLHTAVILLPIAIVFKIEPKLTTLLFVIPGLVLLCVNQIWVAMTLAILSARYRDMLPIVATSVQIMLLPRLFCGRSALSAAQASLQNSIRSII